MCGSTRIVLSKCGYEKFAKSNLSNKIENKRYLLPFLMGNSDIGTTVSDFMAILESISYSKLKPFSNVADEISAKLL